MNTFTQRLLAGEQLMGTFLGTGSALVAEISAMAGLDWGLIDLEHGAGGEAELHGQVSALQRHCCAAVARVESSDRIRIGRALDAGVEAVMVPRVETLGDVEELVRHLSYPPAGDRGVAGYTRAREYGFDGLSHAEVDRKVSAIVQIETPSALGSVRDIAATPGVSALFVGPSDLTTALGFPGKLDDPRFLDVLNTVSSACREAGISAGVLSFDTSSVERYADLGYSLHAVGSDGNTLTRGNRSIAAARPTSRATKQAV